MVFAVDRTYTYRTCDACSTPRTKSPPGARRVVRETDAEHEARFAAERPAGSRVEILYVVEDPSRVRGPVTEPGGNLSGGNPTFTVVADVLTVPPVGAALVAFRSAFVTRSG